MIIYKHYFIFTIFDSRQLKEFWITSGNNYYGPYTKHKSFIARVTLDKVNKRDTQSLQIEIDNSTFYKVTIRLL